MKLPHQEFIRYSAWKDRFLEAYNSIEAKDVESIGKEIYALYPEADERFLRALLSMYVGGYERRVEDPEIRHWTNWAAVETYRTFNAFPNLSDVELAFLFYGLGKLFVPLLLHERGVKSESFKRLSKEEQEAAVREELNVLWENHLIRMLQVLPFFGLGSMSK